jgi:hypothetical protein
VRHPRTPGSTGTGIAAHRYYRSTEPDVSPGRCPARRPADQVTVADVEQAVALAAPAFRGAAAADWHARVGTLEWDCRETVEHLSDDLFAYAAQLGPKTPPLHGPVPFVCEPRRPGGPANTIFADPGSGPTGLVQVPPWVRGRRSVSR